MKFRVQGLVAAVGPNISGDPYKFQRTNFLIRPGKLDPHPKKIKSTPLHPWLVVEKSFGKESETLKNRIPNAPVPSLSFLTQIRDHVFSFKF